MRTAAPCESAKAATENVHAHVHHMTGYARRESKRQRREEAVLARPALPPLAQSVQQERKKTQQPDGASLGQHQQVFVVNGKEETLSKLGGQVAAHDDGEVVRAYSEHGVVFNDSKRQIHQGNARFR